MDFSDYLKLTAEEIGREIDDFLLTWNKHLEKVSPKLLSLGRLFAEHCNGGARLRGTLIKLGFELTGSIENKEILKPAAGYEIFQTAILAQDDVADRSFTRRGRPSLYQALGGDHYGISQTIFLGDLGFFLAEKLIQESSFAENLKYQALVTFTRTFLDTGLGEILDIELPHLKSKVTEEDILTIFRLKTARYTIVGPLHLGAILGGASDKLLSQMVSLGEDLGIAFQIQDDILGIFGDEKTLGKSVTSDIEEGKQTLLITFAREHSDKQQAQVLDKYYGKGKISNSALVKIREVFTQTGALKYAQNKANHLVSEAKKMITETEAPEDKKALLLQMADFIIERPK